MARPSRPSGAKNGLEGRLEEERPGGIGNFSLPLRLEALPDRRFRIVNDGGEAVDSLFLVIIDDDGLHFCQHPGVMAGTMLETVVPRAMATRGELGDRMSEALVAAGLFEKEARAMIKTWQSSWFTEPGARLFYLVPRRLTDEILPLNVEPSNLRPTRWYASWWAEWKRSPQSPSTT